MKFKGHVDHSRMIEPLREDLSIDIKLNSRFSSNGGLPSQEI